MYVGSNFCPGLGIRGLSFGSGTTRSSGLVFVITTSGGSEVQFLSSHLLINKGNKFFVVVRRLNLVSDKRKKNLSSLNIYFLNSLTILKSLIGTVYHVHFR